MNNFNKWFLILAVFVIVLAIASAWQEVGPVRLLIGVGVAYGLWKLHDWGFIK